MAHKEVIGDAELWHGDCYEIIPSISGFECIVTDPPYGLDMRVGTRATKNDVYAGSVGLYRTAFNKIHGDDAHFNPSILLNYGCKYVLWGANNYADKLPPSNGWLVWYKAGGIEGFKMGACELAWTNILGSVRYINHMWHGFKRDSESGEKVLHPTQKPVRVMEWCVSFTTGTVFDPFMGSGSTGVACMSLGRKYIGIEIERQYFDIACKRIENAQRQQRMFA